MKRFLILSCATLAATFAAPNADAGCRVYRGGGFSAQNPGFSYGNRGFSNRGVNNFNSGFNSGFNGGQNGWQNTSQYDYYQGGYIPQGNQLNRIQGRNGFNGTGQWNRYGY